MATPWREKQIDPAADGHHVYLSQAAVSTKTQHDCEKTNGASACPSLVAHLHVSAPPRPALRCFAAPAAKELVEEIVYVLSLFGTCALPLEPTPTEARAAKPTAREAAVTAVLLAGHAAVLVVLRALLLVAQHLVRRSRLGELLRRLRVVLVGIRVVLLRLLVVSALDLGRAGRLFQTEH